MLHCETKVFRPMRRHTKPLIMDGKPGPCEPIKQINASELPVFQVFSFSGQRESSSAENDLASEPGKLRKTSPWKVIFLVAPYA